MTKPTETQTIILSAGAQRPEHIALPLPKGLHGAAAKITISKMIEHGWLQEVEANLRRGEPLWRETGDGHGTTLVVTDAGLLAIGIEPVVVKTMAAIRDHAAEAPAPKQATPRAGTKQAVLIEMLLALRLMKRSSLTLLKTRIAPPSESLRRSSPNPVSK